MYNKTKIFNLACNTALLLSKSITNADTEDSVEAENMRNVWDTAVESFLTECDLNETKETLTLTLVEEDPNDNWRYAYAYPERCAFLRRIVSGYLRDTKQTLIRREVGMLNGEKVIFTNQPEAVAEIISTDDFMLGLSANSALALACKVASLCSALIAQSTDPVKLEATIEAKYRRYMSLASKKDQMENYNPESAAEESDTSYERLS